MHYEFTPAAGRALNYAARAAAGPNVEVGPAALLLGLLAEEECRAALILGRCGVDTTAVTAKWPDLQPGQPRESSHLADMAPTLPPLSPEVEQAIHEAAGKLREYDDAAPLATEHLLFGLVAAEGPMGVWLRERGLEPETLQAEILSSYGHDSGPLAADFGDGAARGGESPRPEAVDGTWDTPRSEGVFTGAAKVPRFALLSKGDVNRTVALRAFDAVANRAGEGLRVVEDYVRFVLDDRHLTGLCKQMRHDLGAVLASVPSEHRLAARDTLADVGTTLATPSEQRRASPEHVLAANLTRLQESFRSLEEFGKLLDPEMGAAMERLRYRSYTLHRAVEITRTSLDRLRDARLYVLVDGRSSLAEFERLARGLVDAGVHVLQLRDKQLADRDLLARARLLRAITASTPTLFIMNDRPDLAALARADGVHVGQDELSAKDARSIVGPEALIGVSTHSIEQARQAVLDGANYLGVGPTFPSGTKHFEQFPGLPLLRQVAAEIRLPAFAIGGITAENLPEVLATGMMRVAVSGAILAALSPIGAATAILAAVNRPGN
jgi:thiamine-phosphate pyrophosphorylase